MGIPAYYKLYPASDPKCLNIGRYRADMWVLLKKIMFRHIYMMIN